MQLQLYTYTVILKEPFVISRDSYAQKEVVIVALQEGAHIGYGEACEHVYYEVTTKGMIKALKAVCPMVEQMTFTKPEDVWDAVAPQLHHHPFALCALDQAAHDLFGKKIGKPTYEILGTNPAQTPPSNYTIGIGAIPDMVKKLHQYSFPVYKIKLGTPEDLDIVEAIRQHTSARLRIDANGAWTAEQTIRYAKELKKLGVELIEQPLPADAFEEMEEVFHKSALPLIADESCCGLADIQRCVGCFHGINIKLMKCGGITPAWRMIQVARQKDLQVMLGCMTEGSIGISALAQLAPLTDYLDADAALLLANDHSSGTYVGANGQLLYNHRNGLGVSIQPRVSLKKAS